MNLPSSATRIGLALLFALVLTVGLAACGGSKKAAAAGAALTGTTGTGTTTTGTDTSTTGTDTSTTGTDTSTTGTSTTGTSTVAQAGIGSSLTPSDFTFQPSMNPGYNDGPAYTATAGDLVADSGFRPWVNGFSFPNYGNDSPAGVTNLTAVQMQNLFGTQVCLTGSGSSCQLTVAAADWMSSVNNAMANGHCFGFSVTALRMFNKSLSPSAFGAAVPVELTGAKNAPLQEQIAQDWAEQTLPAVESGTLVGTPNATLQALITALKGNHGPGYTIEIFNKVGAHAVTPFAVEDNGGGIYHVLIYDNNFPGIVRAIEFDTTSDSWQYRGGTNPQDLGELYDGTGNDGNIRLVPITVGQGMQPAPFGNGQGSSNSGAAVGSVLPTAKRYEEIRLEGSPTNHAHLLLINAQNQKTGYVNGTLVNGIPGVKVVRVATGLLGQEPEPAYQIPVGQAIGVEVDGSDLTKPDTEALTLIGPGDDFKISQIILNPGQKDFIVFHPGGDDVGYSTNAPASRAPLIEIDAVRGAGRSAQGYKFLVTPELTGRGTDTLDVILSPSSGTYSISTAGSISPGAIHGYNVFGVEMVRETVSGTDKWSDSKLVLAAGRQGETGVLFYTHPWATKQRIPLIISATAHGSRRVEYLTPGGP